MEKNKPVRTLWHGNVKANIWQNQTQNGAIFSVNYARIYSDKQGTLREAFTFSDVENLRLAALARQTGDVLNQLKQDYNAKSKAQAEPPPQQHMPQQGQQPVQQHSQHDDGQYAPYTPIRG